MIGGNGATQQSLAADGGIACFSSSLVSFRLNADCAPQLKAAVMPLQPFDQVENSR
jgi:hypothetical protein